MEGEAVAAAEISTLWVIIIALVIGGIAGWLAGLVVEGMGFGLIGNILVGIVGAIIAAFLFPWLGFDLGGGFVAAIVEPMIGAIIFLVILGLIRRA
ncbi:MAG: GlsB/YeaQ/YmgE family stress response membrane protein [Rhizobiales bacterium]|nr:GlsB/YeaQ/YmgE family stress response membrane protein [Hyphomicrobiales bacterium]